MPTELFPNLAPNAASFGCLAYRRIFDVNVQKQEPRREAGVLVNADCVPAECRRLTVNWGRLSPPAAPLVQSSRVPVPLAVDPDVHACGFGHAAFRLAVLVQVHTDVVIGQDRDVPVDLALRIL